MSALNDLVLDGSAAAELRTLVSEVLAEVLPGLAARSLPAIVAPAPVLAAGRIPSGIPAGAPAGAVPPSPARPGAGAAESWTVSVDSDADLDALVRRVLKLADNPKSRQDLIAGRVRFRLAGRLADPATTPVHRVDRGAVTERAVREAAKLGARLVLGRRAVLTPLGRDTARALGVPIEKER